MACTQKDLCVNTLERCSRFCVCVLLPIETVAWEPFEADEKPDERSPGSFLDSLTSAPSNFSPAPL